MTRESIASFRNPWFTASVGITAAIALVAAVVGFVWLPLQHPGERFKGVWDAICSAAGLVRNAPSGDQIVRANYVTTTVEIDPQMLQSASAEAIEEDRRPTDTLRSGGTPMTTRTPRFGFRVLGSATSRRRPIDFCAAFAAYAECDDKAEVGREAYLSAFTYGDDFRRHLFGLFHQRKNFLATHALGNVLFQVDHLRFRKRPFVVGRKRFRIRAVRLQRGVAQEPRQRAVELLLTIIHRHGALLS